MNIDSRAILQQIELYRNLLIKPNQHCLFAVFTLTWQQSVKTMNHNVLNTSTIDSKENHFIDFQLQFEATHYLCNASPQGGGLVPEKLEGNVQPASQILACSAGRFWRGEWIYISIGCSGHHLELEKQWRVGAR